MANTTNLNLEKPLDTDQALISVINSNSDKIDAYAGSTNQALSNKVNPIYDAPTETFNGDLDTLTTPGWYVLGTSATNAPPITASGRLLVAQMGTSPYIRQTYYCGYDNRIFTRVRSYYNNAWQWFEWQQLVLKSDITVDEYVVAGGLILRKFGKVCVLNGYYTWSSTQSGEVTIGTLPAEYRPKHAIRALANIGSNAWSYSRTAYFTVADNGNVNVIPADSSGYVAVYVNCSWVLI